MYKLLVWSCLLASCLAVFLQPREEMQRRPPRGCGDRAAGRLACGRANNTDTLAPHPHDCRLYFYCHSNGVPPACRRCPARLHFNPELQMCDWPNNAQCTAQPRPRPHPTARPPNNGTATPGPEPTSTASPTSTVYPTETTTYG